MGAFRAGLIDLPRLRAIADAVVGLDDAAAVAVQDRVLVRAPGQTAAQLRTSLNAAVLAHDPAAAQARYERAVEDRRVVLTPQVDGMAELGAASGGPGGGAGHRGERAGRPCQGAR